LFLLDTNVVSELRKASRCHTRVAAWQAAQEREACYISTVTLLEIRLGIELARKNDCKKASVLEAWFAERVKPGFAGRMLVVDDKVSEMCGRLHAEHPRSFRDGMILATAAVHRLTVVTRNVNDFVNGGVEVINPWD
jgi:hypothetical protein